MIYTFYSYKGGVGRSMALANIAELFYRSGLKVLMVDWDLEAPGLERFCQELVNPEEILDKPGIMDMLLEYKEQMALEKPVTRGEEDRLPFEDLERFIVNIYPQTKEKSLFLLSAGRRSGAYFPRYANAVLTFDWSDFYRNWEGERFIEGLKQSFRQMADVILIDSRTGVTEMGGVCTYHLADTVVMFCTPSEQSLAGTLKMAQNLTSPQVTSLRGAPPLNLLIVPARLERAESDLLDEFQGDFERFFKDFIHGSVGIQELWGAGVPYIPKYAYKEIVAVRESGRASAVEMTSAFASLAEIMAGLAGEETAKLVRDSLPEELQRVRRVTPKPRFAAKTQAPPSGAQPADATEAQSRRAGSMREPSPEEEYDWVLDDLARAIVGERCALFLGPACSETVKMRSELGLTADETPTRRSLVCNLARELDDEDLLAQIKLLCGESPECSHCLLPEAASRYEEAFGRKKLRDFLRTQLRGGKPRGFHHQLWNLRFAAIYTVNYDELLETSLEGTSLGVVTNDNVFATVSLPLREATIPIYKLHGSIDAEEVVITQDDQLQLGLRKTTLALWKRLYYDFQTKIFLFVGYPLGDTDVLESIFSSYNEGQRPPQSYAVIDKPPPRNAARLLRKYNIKIVHRNVDRFFADLVQRHRSLVFQMSQVSTTIPLEQRFPSIGDSFKQIVDTPGFSGLCLYGKSEKAISKDRIAGELRVLPTEMEVECRRRQARGERILCVSLNIAQSGTQVRLDSLRFVQLLGNLVVQLDRERAAVRLPSIDLAGKLAYDSKNLWESEANARVQAYWRRELAGDEAAIREVDQEPTQEQLQMSREIRERYLTGQAADWLNLELESALAGYRLIVFITDFELIETDEKWFTRVSQNFLNKLCDYNVGLAITRQAARPFSAEKTFSSYNLDRFTQYDLAELIEGG